MPQEKKNRASLFVIITFIIAIISFIMSSVALFITYDNGRLLMDAQVLMKEIGSSVMERKSAFHYVEEQEEKDGEEDEATEMTILKSKVDTIRSRFRESEDYNETSTRIEELKKDLDAYQNKWGTISREKYSDLKYEINKTITALKEKSKDSSRRLESLCDQINKLIKKEEP